MSTEVALSAILPGFSIVSEQSLRCCTFSVANTVTTATIDSAGKGKYASRLSASAHVVGRRDRSHHDLPFSCRRTYVILTRITSLLLASDVQCTLRKVDSPATSTCTSWTVGWIVLIDDRSSTHHSFVLRRFLPSAVGRSSSTDVSSTEANTHPSAVMSRPYSVGLKGIRQVGHTN